MRAIANEQIPADRNSQLAQALDLGNERDGIDDGAVADYASFSTPEYAGRDQMQNVLHASMNDGMSSVVPSLAADNDVSFSGEDIDNLAFALVAPLRPD